MDLRTNGLSVKKGFKVELSAIGPGVLRCSRRWILPWSFPARVSSVLSEVEVGARGAEYYCT